MALWKLKEDPSIKTWLAGSFLGIGRFLIIMTMRQNFDWLGSVDPKSDPYVQKWSIIHVFCSFINQKGDFRASAVCYSSNEVNLRKALWADLKRMSSVVIDQAWIVMGDLNSSRFHEEKMGGSGRSHNTDLHRCLLDIDLFDLPARSILGPTAEIVSRLLPGSLTEYWLMTVGLLPSRTLKQTSQGQVFLPLPSGRSWSQGRSL